MSTLLHHRPCDGTNDRWHQSDTVHRSTDDGEEKLFKGAKGELEDTIVLLEDVADWIGSDGDGDVS